MKNKMKQLCGIILSLVLVLGLMPGMSLTAQAATTLTDTFTTNTGATEYTGNYSKVTASVSSGYEGLGIAHSDNHPITIETLHGEIIDKVVLSGVTNSQNVYIHPSSGNVTNTIIRGHCYYRLNDDGAIEIENINSTTLTISFHPGYLGTCFYANVVVYCHEVPVDITGVELNKTSTTLTVGETDTLTATVNPDNSDHTVAWSSDNESVATVSDGVVTAVAEGSATITATATNGTDDTSDDKTATCAVTVASASVPISYTVTFKVVNGSWDDGTTADKIVTLTGNEGDTLKLTTEQIPAVGTKPNDGYKAGSWDVTPSTETAISSNVTYTYTYVADSSGGSSDSGSGDSSGGSSDSGSGSSSSSSSDSSNSTQSTAPKTGDPNDIREWYLLLLASLGGLGVLGFAKKKDLNR